MWSSFLLSSRIFSGVTRLMPIPFPSFAHWASVPEPGPLPSTGITRFQQYYEPLRLLQWPGPLSCPLPGGSGHHCRSPVLRVILCVHAMPIAPASGPAFICRFIRPALSAFAHIGEARRSHRDFRGLLGLHSRLRPAHLQALLKRTTVPGASTGRSPFPPSG